MAKTKSKAKTPAVRYLRYELTNSSTPGNETSHFIDLARDLSRVNRRLYRQGRDYHVRKITVVSSNTPNGDNRISVSTALDSWVTRKAWRRGFDMHQLMKKRATVATAGTVKAKYEDFKIYLHSDMATGTVLAPIDNGGNAYLGGEWEYSKFQTPDGTTSADEFYATLHGNHVGGAGSRTSVGLIRSYGESRATVNTDDPNVPSTVDDDPLVNLFDDGTVFDEVIEHMRTDNDGPPYATVSYPGDDTNGPKPCIVADATIKDGSCVIGGFSAIAGLLELETKSPIGDDVYSVLVELAPGNYRGIAADVI